MVAWLWNSRSLLRAATARPTVILPTAGGPKITSRRWPHRHPVRRQDLHPIPVTVEGVQAQVAREGRALAVVDLEAEPAEALRQPVELAGRLEDESRVRLAGGRERVLDADVDLGGDRAGVVVRPEPGAAAGPEVRGLLDLGHPEPVAVEPPGVVLGAGGHRDLDVVSLIGRPRDPGHREDPAERQHHAVPAVG